MHAGQGQPGTPASVMIWAMNSDQLQRLVSDHLGGCTWDMDLERDEIHYSD